jgi:hypothetical protein
MLEIIVNILFNIAEVTFPPINGGSKEPAY